LEALDAVSLEVNTWERSHMPSPLESV